MEHHWLRCGGAFDGARNGRLMLVNGIYRVGVVG